MKKKTIAIRQIIVSLIPELPTHRLPLSGFQLFWFLFVKYLQWYPYNVLIL